MEKYKAYVIDVKCRYEFQAHFIHIFQLDPVDIESRIFYYSTDESSFVEATASFWKAFKEEYQPTTVKECKIHIQIIPLEETTFH